MLGFSPISTAPICAQRQVAAAARMYAITDWSGHTLIGIVGPTPDLPTDDGPVMTGDER